MRWLFKKRHIHPNIYYNYLRNAKAGYLAQNLIVVNGFKHFTMIRMVSWGTVK